MVRPSATAAFAQALTERLEKLQVEQAAQELNAPLVMRMDDSNIEYVSRTASQDVDTVAVSHIHPEYFIIGTYSLVKRNEPREYEAQVRKGMLQVMTVAEQFTPSYPGMLPPVLDQINFTCAVLDIQFHPADLSLLGVATSSGRLYFYRFVKHGDVLGRRVITKLLPLGKVKAAPDDEFGLIQLVTNFTWFPEFSTHGVPGVDDFHRVSFACTASLGGTRIVTVEVPAINTIFDPRLANEMPDLAPITKLIHQRALEAWVVAAIPIHYSHDTVTRLILSGGDDNAVVASSVDFPNTTSSDYTPDEEATMITALWEDKRIHDAGVVAIVPLPAITVPQTNGANGTKEMVPVLTGSYDDTLRVLELDMASYRPLVKAEMQLYGGVWKIKILDEYSTIETEAGTPILLSENDTGHTTHGKATRGPNRHHRLLLVSLMHSGVMLLRLTLTPDGPETEREWTIDPVQTFRRGHESMVYCCDAVREFQQEEVFLPEFNSAATSSEAKREEYRSQLGADYDGPKYTIISTSFYDKKVCTWPFVDQFKGAALKMALAGEQA